MSRPRIASPACAGAAPFVALALALTGCSSPAAPGSVAALLTGGWDDPGACIPMAGGPHWIEEGEGVRTKVRCSTGRELAPGAVRVAGLPEGARFDAVQAELRWTPRLDQAGVYEIPIHVDETGETGSVKIGVADAFGAPGNVPIADPALYAEEMGLPVFHLEADQEMSLDAYAPVEIVYRGHRYAAEARLRGRTSMYYPKRGLALRFQKADRFDEPEHGGGFRRRRKLVLISNFDDNSYLRPRLSFELWNRLQPSVPVKSWSAVVYLNGAFHGLFTVADFVDADLFEMAGLPGTGNLYKAVDHDADFQDRTPRGSGFEKTEGWPPAGDAAAFDDLAALIAFVAHAPDAAFRDEVGTWLELGDYGAWWILTSAIAAIDSMGKNAYHYHPSGSERWRVVPWDFNASWGQSWDTRRLEHHADPVEMGKSANRLFARLILDPLHADALRARYREALERELHIEHVLALVDALATEVAGAARRDERRWGAAYRDYGPWRDREDFTDHAREVEHIRSWAKARWALLAATL